MIDILWSFQLNLKKKKKVMLQQQLIYNIFTNIDVANFLLVFI